MSQHPNVKLILSDIDGTLLPFGQRVVSQRVRDSFHMALDAGIHVGPASGRGISHVTPSFAGDVACTATALATNGMQVYLDGELVHEEHLPREALVRVTEVIAEVPGTGAIVFEGGTPLLVAGTREDLGLSFPMYAEQALDHEGVPEFPIVKMNVFCTGDLAETQQLCELVEREVPELGFNVPLARFLNITPKGYSKASGIDILCEALGIGLDQVVTFGDGGNDLEMIAHVPNGVAVAGAVPEVAAAAHWHIGPCEEDAVPTAIDALAAGEWPFER